MSEITKLLIARDQIRVQPSIVHREPLARSGEAERILTIPPAEAAFELEETLAQVRLMVPGRIIDRKATSDSH